MAEFGYQFKLRKINLPRIQPQQLSLEKLKQTFYKKLPHVSLNSEAAKREFFVSPLLLELLDYIEIDIDVEYNLNVNQCLKGSVDYLLRGKHSFLVIEAKNADLDREFTQLAVELIAAAQLLESDDNLLYGAVTIGDVWRFGVLDKERQIIYKDIDAFLVPGSLEDLFSVLLGILD